MKSDKSLPTSSMTTRQKLTIVALIIVVLLIVWEIYSLFGSGSSTPSIKPTPTANHPPAAMNSSTPNGMMPQTPPPQPAQLMKPQQISMTPEEANLMRMQQQSESQYLSAINQLQMLKVERDIAETNKAIMTAKLETVTAEKRIVDLLQPPAPPPTTATYARGLVNPVSTNVEPANVHPPMTTTVTTTTPTPPPAPTVTPDVNYTVISVSRLQNRWAAVVGYQGSLFNVSVGDILPPDSSMVISIGRSGILLEKKGVKRKISLVPII